MKNIETIYLEGADCVGKNTVGKQIYANRQIARVGNLYLFPDINPWNADRTGDVPSGHPLYPAYLIKSIIWDVVHFDSGDSHLQISFTGIRSAAWQMAADYPLRSFFYELLDYCPIFNHAFLLTASVDARMERLQSREAKDPESVSEIDKKITTDREFVERMDKIITDISRLKMGVIVIDTSNITPTQVSDQITNYIEGRISRVDSSDSRRYQKEIRDEIERFDKELAIYIVLTARQFNLSESDVEMISRPILSSKQ